MTNPSSVTEILQAAIKEEEEANAFYAKVAETARDAAVREIFLGLAKEELGHKQFLLGCMADTELLKKVSAPMDYKVAEATAEPPLSTDMKPVDAIALAMKKEQQAAEGYRNMARSTSDAHYRQMFEKLSEMELAHKAALESAFVNIGYPEVF
ncbi:MAG TPA: ferritin family protein [Polyangiaceae bacterium]|nr:ferritin family protein [Polyangiaceae bacterium]